MLDIRSIRDDPDAFDAALKRRGLESCAKEVLKLDAAHREALSALEADRRSRKEAAKEFGKAKASGKAPAKADAGQKLKERIREGEDSVRRRAEKLNTLLSGLPNPPLDDVPDGLDESANREVSRFGEPPAFDFPARRHFELGEALGLMDFEAATRLSGSRFVVLKGALARLERVLAGFMLDIHTKEFGYTEVSPPALVLEKVMFGTAQLPKFRDDQFSVGEDFWLIPTAEVPLTNLAREQVMAESDLPMRMTAFTPCFRKEAGAAGKDTRGMIRQHQFSKVELVSVTRPEDSAAELERMLSCAEAVLQRLGLHYRVVILSAGDMGFAACKTFDIEVWLPGEDCFREISSCSVCGDFQARRMGARYRPSGGSPQFVHTLNGSGVAVGRCLVALLESFQRADGSIAIPEVLQAGMGMDVIGV